MNQSLGADLSLFPLSFSRAPSRMSLYAATTCEAIERLPPDATAAATAAAGEEPLPLLPLSSPPSLAVVATIVIGENVERSHASLPRTADASALASRCRRALPRIM